MVKLTKVKAKKIMKGGVVAGIIIGIIDYLKRHKEVWKH